MRAHISEKVLEALPGVPGLPAPLAAFVPLYFHPPEIRRAACTNGMSISSQEMMKKELWGQGYLFLRCC